MMMSEKVLKYPDSELSLKEDIENLNGTWFDFLKKQFVDESCNTEKLFVSDGFYPYYTFQKKKILFIGREALEIGGCNYMEFLYEAYQEKQIGSLSLNRHKFHSTMLYLTYAICHGA